MSYYGDTYAMIGVDYYMEDNTIMFFVYKACILGCFLLTMTLEHVVFVQFDNNILAKDIWTCEVQWS